MSVFSFVKFDRRSSTRRRYISPFRKISRTDECEIIGGTRKHRYLLPLTPANEGSRAEDEKSYPKRAK
jgi:hypothetical protein